VHVHNSGAPRGFPPVASIQARRFSGRRDDAGLPMKVLVAVKRVVDYNVKIRVKADKTGV